MPEPRLLVARDGPVLTVRFNRPPRHFFDEQMSIELDDLTRRVARDRGIRAVILTGQGDSYITHYDVPELLDAAHRSPFRMSYRLARVVAIASSQASRSRRIDRWLRRTIARDLATSARSSAAFRRMAQDDTVYITAINGHALGMGCIVALNCDLRLMADGRLIGLPEASLGFVAAAGGTQKLVRTVGAGRALHLMLEGELLIADDAAAAGLVHRVVGADALLAAAREAAMRVSSMSPYVTRELKRLVYDAGSRPLAAGLRQEAASVIATMSSAPARQGLTEYRDLLRVHDPLDDDTMLGIWRARDWAMLASGADVAHVPDPHL